jgi:hypothetical protein
MMLISQTFQFVAKLQVAEIPEILFLALKFLKASKFVFADSHGKQKKDALCGQVKERGGVGRVTC